MWFTGCKYPSLFFKGKKIKRKEKKNLKCKSSSDNDTTNNTRKISRICSSGAKLF
jgi:hypothetical protein